MRLVPSLAAILLFATAAHASGNLDISGEKICPMIYQPVCAASDGTMRNFPNKCVAENAGYSVVAKGTCEGGPQRIFRSCDADGNCKNGGPRPYGRRT